MGIVKEIPRGYIKFYFKSIKRLENMTAFTHKNYLDYQYQEYLIHLYGQVLFKMQF